MNQPFSFAASSGSDSPSSAAPNPLSTPTTYKVPRRGKRPLGFAGSELCMAMNFVPGCHSWYEVNIYRTIDQKFVLCVRQFFRDENETDRVRAWECDSFGDVLERLESYDAADDVRVDAFADDPSLSVPEMVAHAFSLRAKAESARRQFGALVGEILSELDANG